ncbi:hypothetical protein MNB_SM-7-1379 [hydrothermal vent metagenome]|uniref:Uncharacterized protein n=1 Tax=hydrothermal vent metagenome TaxID=652676 RepID=A0A1W1BYP6_9ZZZZ
MFLFIVSFLYADGYKSIAVIPADINYNNQDAVEFGEVLYDAVLDGIASYNFAQQKSENMYKITKEIEPKKENSPEIKSAHIALKNDPQTFLKQNKLDKAIVMDFSTKRAAYIINNCQGICDIKISLAFYAKDLNVSSSKKEFTYKYDGNSCLLSDKSLQSLKDTQASFLAK